MCHIKAGQSSIKIIAKRTTTSVMCYIPMKIILTKRIAKRTTPRVTFELQRALVMGW